jgi:hypothetical protein
MARPKEIFLVATYLKAPREAGKTIHKGYMNDDKNISYREKVTITRGLKDRDLTAGIILNLTQKTVYKCHFDGKNDWETLAQYYAKSYPEYFKMIDPPEPEQLDGDEELVAIGEEGELILSEGAPATEDAVDLDDTPEEPAKFDEAKFDEAKLS